MYMLQPWPQKECFFFFRYFTQCFCNSEEYLVVGGSYNCTDNPYLDRNHQEPHAASKRSLIKLIEHFELCDIWRFFHKNHWQYTWVHSRDFFIFILSLGRLDRVYCFAHHINVFNSCTISPVGFSDHSLVQVSIHIKDLRFKIAYWEFNNFPVVSSCF